MHSRTAWHRLLLRKSAMASNLLAMVQPTVAAEQANDVKALLSSNSWVVLLRTMSLLGQYQETFGVLVAFGRLMGHQLWLNLAQLNALSPDFNLAKTISDANALPKKDVRLSGLAINPPQKIDGSRLCPPCQISSSIESLSCARTSRLTDCGDSFCQGCRHAREQRISCYVPPRQDHVPPSG